MSFLGHRRPAGRVGVMNFVLAVLLPRFLGGAGYGHYALASPGPVADDAGDLGLNSFLVAASRCTRYVSSGPDQGVAVARQPACLLASTTIAVAGTIIAVTTLSWVDRGPFAWPCCSTP